MICIKCGCNNADGYKFCQNCGEQLFQPQPVEQPQQEQYQQTQQPYIAQPMNNSVEFNYQPPQAYDPYQQPQYQNYNPYGNQINSKPLADAFENSYSAFTYGMVAIVLSFFSTLISYIFAIITFIKAGSILPIDMNYLNPLERDMYFKLEKKKRSAKSFATAAFVIPIIKFVILILFYALFYSTFKDMIYDYGYNM